MNKKSNERNIGTSFFTTRKKHTPHANKGVEQRSPNHLEIFIDFRFHPDCRICRFHVEEHIM